MGIDLVATSRSSTNNRPRGWGWLFDYPNESKAYTPGHPNSPSISAFVARTMRLKPVEKALTVIEASRASIDGSPRPVARDPTVSRPARA
jgi:hypothetical protein